MESYTTVKVMVNFLGSRKIYSSIKRRCKDTRKRKNVSAVEKRVLIKKIKINIYNGRFQVYSAPMSTIISRVEHDLYS